MAKSWNDVASSIEYQSLPEDRKEVARTQYFNSVVAPKVPQEKLDVARQQFDTSSKAPIKDDRSFVSKALGLPILTPEDKKMGLGSALASDAKTIGSGLINTVAAPLLMTKAGLENPGTEKGYDAARNLAMTAAGGMGGAKGATAKITETPLQKSLTELGVGKLKKNPNQIQGALKAGLENTTSSLAKMGGGTPNPSPSNLAENVTGSMGKAYRQLNDIVRKQYDVAREYGKNVDASSVSNKEALENIISQEKDVMGFDIKQKVQKLRDQRLTDESDIIGLRQQLHDLEYAGTHESPKTQVKAELSQRRIQAAKDQMAKKQELAASRDNQLQELEKKMALAPKGGMPTEIKTAEDLVNAKQALNKVRTMNMSDAELKMHQSKIEEVNKALEEVKKASPQFANYINKANKTYATKLDRYEGKAASSLGVDESLLEASHNGSKEALQNALASSSKLSQKIYAPFQVDWLKTAMKPKEFKELMSTKVNELLSNSVKSAEYYKENRELIEHILANGLGVKEGLYKPKLEAIDTVLKELENGKISLQMSPKEYRDALGLAARSVNALKATVSTVTSGGRPNAYGMSKAAEAVGVDHSGEAKRLLTLRKKVQEQSQNLSGPVVGGAIGGAIGQRENQ